MSSIRATLAAAACLLVATACEKHQGPIGAVPADDVPAAPVRGAAIADRQGGLDCDRTMGAEREACPRNNPPETVSPAEPEKSRPPAR